MNATAMNIATKARDISTSILQNVLQTGRLDYVKTISGLMDLTGSTKAQFFTNILGYTFLCKYSNTNDFTVGNKYLLDNLPINQYVVYHRTNIIAIICLDNQDILEDLSDDVQKRIHDSICVGLVMENLKDAKFDFTMSVCRELARNVDQVIQMFHNVTPNRIDPRYIEKINTTLNDLITIIIDTIDFLEIDEEKVTLEQNVVNMGDFLRETVSIVQDMFTQGRIATDLDDNANRSLVFDKSRVQQMLISLLKKLVGIENLRVRVALTGRILVFQIYSLTTRSNKEIQNRLTAEKVTVATLDIFVVKRLCEIMHGRLAVDEEAEGVMIKIMVSLS